MMISLFFLHYRFIVGWALLLAKWTCKGYFPRSVFSRWCSNMSNTLLFCWGFEPSGADAQLLGFLEKGLADNILKKQRGDRIAILRFGGNRHWQVHLHSSYNIDTTTIDYIDTLTRFDFRTRRMGWQLAQLYSVSIYSAVCEHGICSIYSATRVNVSNLLLLSTCGFSPVQIQRKRNSVLCLNLYRSTMHFPKNQFQGLNISKMIPNCHLSHFWFFKPPDSDFKTSHLSPISPTSAFSQE